MATTMELAAAVFVVACTVSLLVKAHLKSQKTSQVPRGYSAAKLGASPINRDGDELGCERDGFSKKKVPEDLDAIIIGSGIGGLACGAMLSRAGKRVLVVEQHYIAGGSTHVFDEAGVEFDTGVHYIGNIEKRKKYLDLITETPLEWDKMGTRAGEDGTYDEICVGTKDGSSFPEKWTTYKYRSGHETFIEDTVKRFGEKHRPAVVEYVRLCYEVAKKDVFFDLKVCRPAWLGRIANRFASRKFFAWCAKSAHEVVADLTDDLDLRACLLGQFGDAGRAPKDISFFMHASVAAHYFSGGYFPRGGSGEIAKRLIPTIERTGGRVLVRKAAASIILDASGAKAIGVKMANGHEIFARGVISACGVFNTYRKLLPRAAVPALVEKNMEAIGESCSMVYLFVRMKGTPEENKLRSSNIWHWPDRDYDQMLADYYAAPETAPMPMFIGFPCAKDSTWNARYKGEDGKGVSNAVILTMAKYEWFSEWETARQGARGPEYEAKKKMFEGRILEGLYHHYPHLRTKVDWTLVGSTVTFNFYIGSHKGEVYGLDATKERFTPDDWLRPETATKNLYLTGQDVTTLGVTGALMSGVLTAHAVLGYGGIDDLASGRNLIEDLWHLDHKNGKGDGKGNY